MIQKRLSGNHIVMKLRLHKTDIIKILQNNYLSTSFFFVFSFQTLYARKFAKFKTLSDLVAFTKGVTKILKNPFISSKVGKK